MEGDVLAENQAAAVLFRYARAVDTKDWPLLSECFTPECAFVAPNRRLSGRDEIVDFMRSAHEHIDGSMHRLSNIVIELADDEMSGLVSSYLDALIVHRAHRDGPTCKVIGTYRDRMSSEDGVWRIAERSFQLLWREGSTTLLGPTISK